MLILALAFLLSSGPGNTAAPASDVWPMWRGPTGDSVSTSRDLPMKWSKTENVVWKTPLTWGNSSPVIWKDAVFITMQDKERLLFLRLDRATGKVVWEREVGKGTPRRTGALGNGRYHEEHNMASPSPITDGKHVWVHFGTGDLACFDFDGKQVWTMNLTQPYGPYSIWWGHANSPVLFEDLLICVCMQDPKGGGKNYLVALDKATGKEKWFVKRETGAQGEPADSYTTPLFHRQGDKTEMIIFGGNVLDAYDPATGKKLWQSNPFKGNRVISGPTLHGDTVFATQGMKGPVFAIKTGGAGDVTASHVRWKYAGNQTPDAASPVVAKGLVFLATNNGFGVCIDAETGKEQWKERLGDAFRSTPLVVGDKIYFLGKDGETSIVEASRKFNVLAKSKLGEDTIASPAVAGNDLFIRTREHLYCIGEKKN